MLLMWVIENYIYCSHKNGEALDSPEFLADSLERTRWYLQLYPRGILNESKKNISLILLRSSKDEGPEKISINWELSFLAADGSVLNALKSKYQFGKITGRGHAKFIPVDDVLLLKRAIYLPHGSLNVRCRIWRDEGDLQQVTRIDARTRIEIEHISFLHIIENFEALEPNQKQMVQFRSAKPESNISASVHVTNCSCRGEKIIVEITPPGSKYILWNGKVSMIDGSGLITKCEEIDYGGDEARQGNFKIPLSFAKETILKRKDKYLPNDKLTLLCECIFSFGGQYACIEKVIHDMPSTVLNHLINDKTSSAKNLCANSNALDDLKAFYDDQFLTDVELKTKTKSFHAHKIVLCARSSVFKAMMSSDMKEKNTDKIEIDDLDDETLEQLLLFLYWFKLDDLQWDNATKLYYAADKYEIKTLKTMCSDFFMGNLEEASAIKLLLLADAHNDVALKEIVEDFILDHEEEVFGSDEWEELMETKPQLVMKTMHLKYRKMR